MKIFNSLDDIEQIPNAQIALGAFDGIHLGHQKIIERTVSLAQENGGTSVVFTFSNHPLAALSEKRCPPQIISRPDKEKLIAGLGADVLCNVPFTKKFAKLSAADFINLLRQKFELKQVVVGDNYRYGCQGQGNAASLQKAGAEFGFAVEALALAETTDPLTLKPITVSSSVIRDFLKEGKVSAAAFLLGRPFSVSGTVGSGAKRGRRLGYPTANILEERELILPADGVYAANILVEQTKYQGVVNIGANPTFNCRDRALEVHMLDFSGDLYGENLTVEFVWRIRPETKFASAEELKQQIGKDIEEAKILLQSFNL